MASSNNIQLIWLTGIVLAEWEEWGCHSCRYAMSEPSNVSSIQQTNNLNFHFELIESIAYRCVCQFGCLFWSRLHMSSKFQWIRLAASFPKKGDLSMLTLFLQFEHTHTQNNFCQVNFFVGCDVLKNTKLISVLAQRYSSLVSASHTESAYLTNREHTLDKIDFTRAWNWTFSFTTTEVFGDVAKSLLFFLAQPILASIYCTSK